MIWDQTNHRNWSNIAKRQETSTLTISKADKQKLIQGNKQEVRANKRCRGSDGGYSSLVDDNLYNQLGNGPDADCGSDTAIFALVESKLTPSAVLFITTSLLTCQGTTLTWGWQNVVQRDWGEQVLCQVETQGWECFVSCFVEDMIGSVHRLIKNLCLPEVRSQY